LLEVDGALSIVLPLSVVTSTREPFPLLRRHLAQQGGALELLSFDRVPDALFGDDIKTRNSIIYLDRAAPSSLAVSPLFRWTSRTRDTALVSIPVTSAEGLVGVPRTIPKFGADWERRLFRACGAHGTVLQDWSDQRRQLPLVGIPRDLGGDTADTLAVAPTAYNFLGVVRDPHRAVTDGHDSRNAFSLLKFRTDEHASAAYAILSGRLAFWIWHVTGDGFHVNRALFGIVPAPPPTGPHLAELALLGDRLWKEAIQKPVTSVNRGRTTIAYPAWTQGALIDRIDEQIGTFLGTDLMRRLRNWHDKLVVVDAGSDRRNKIRRTDQ
jgi:hypothetical protein